MDTTYFMKLSHAQAAMKAADEIYALRQRVLELEKGCDEYHQVAMNHIHANEKLTAERDELLSDVERCYRMLLSEPDTQGALFKAENILREAIASVKEK